MTFTNLHLHTEYSVLDGAGKIADYIAEAKRLGQTSLAMTDHGNLYGAYEFWKQCTAAGIKPIIGYEAYVAPTETAVKEPVFLGPEELRRHDVGGRGAYTHMLLLAQSAVGLRNLFRLHSLGHTGDRFYYKPRVDLDTLRTHSKGLVATTGCAGGHVPTLLRLGQQGAAEEWAGKLKDIFGDRLYVELMYHGITDQGDDGFDELQLNRDLMALARSKGLPMVMTNDCHYVKKHDADKHDALLCVQTRAKLADEKRFRFSGNGFYLKSEEEMQDVCRLASIPEDALSATGDIARSVQSYDAVFTTQLRMPQLEGDLRQEVFSSERYGDEFEARVMAELAVIEGSGFEDYFLVLADVIAWAKANGIPVGPGRGSAGGSLVSFVLGITDINPLEHDLLFERFLNPERVDLPDIDNDIADRDLPRVHQYMIERFGAERVARIMTLGTVGAKAALKDSARVLGHPYKMGEELVSYLPEAVFGRQPSLDELPAVEGADNREIVQLARGLEGLVRSTGVHAAGVVLSPVDLVEVMPTSFKDGAQVTGFDAGPVQALGLVKMDFLGLRNLTVLHDCIRSLGWTWDQLLALPLNDKATYQLLSSGNTDGVFQLDSDGMKRLLKDVKPSGFNDIAAVLALYRPGPMGAGAHRDYAKRKSAGRVAQTIHDEFGSFDGILDETYGLIVFQEQVMRLLQKVGGYGLGEADLVRKAMGKKDRQLLAKLKPEFLSRLDGRGYSTDAAEALWATLEPFADYAFNKAHSVGYGMLSYWTAYLKAHHPREYMSALLSSVSSDPDRLGQYLQEVKRMGIKILPPTVNATSGDFTHSDKGIHYALKAIKGFGENAYAKLSDSAPFGSLDDFFQRAPSAVLNAGVLRALVCSGALDVLEPRRVALAEGAEALAARALEARKKKRSGKTALFKQRFGLAQLDETVESLPLYIEWETQYLGISLTSNRVTLVPARDLTEQEWDWVAYVIANNPGDDEVVVKIGNQLVDTGYTVNIEGARGTLAKLAAFDLGNMVDEDAPPWKI